ncbi:MAG: hypothetical protein ACFFCZ_17925 [Promethearchaeota archaeon]
MLIKHLIMIKCFLLLCFMFLNTVNPIEFIVSPSSPNSFSYPPKKTMMVSSNTFNRIFYPENNTIINFTPVPILVRPLYNASLMEMRINNGSWSPLIFNTNYQIGLNFNDSYQLYDRYRHFFWYGWLSIDKTDAECTIDFRENSTHIWEEQLRFTSALSSLPALSLESVQLKYVFEARGLMVCYPKHTYLFDGTSHSFHVEKENLKSGTSAKWQSYCPTMTGKRVLTSTEVNALFTYITELVYIIPNLNISGLINWGGDEYFPIWHVTITWWGNAHSLVYENEYFLPPVFSSFIDFLEELASNTPGYNPLLPIGILALTIGITDVIAAAIIFKFWRKKRLNN